MTGVVQQVGTPMDLYERPANLFVANFLGTANILAGDVVGSGPERHFAIEGGIRVPIPPDTIVPDGAKLVFRPQHAGLTPPEVSSGNALTLPCSVAHREFLGASVRYGVRFGTTEIGVDVPFQSGAELFEIGARATLTLPQRLLLWLAA